MSALTFCAAAVVSSEAAQCFLKNSLKISNCLLFPLDASSSPIYHGIVGLGASGDEVLEILLTSDIQE